MGTKESVHFKFMFDEEVRRQSVVKITSPDLLDIVDKPIPGGLYDPAMGPLDDGSSCKSCGKSFYHCNGHCGHIDLVLPSYNPLLFNTLNKLLNKVCFYCFHFRSSRGEVANSFSQLKLIEKGDIVGAKKLRLRQDLQDKKETELMLPDDIIDREDSQESHASHPAFLSDDEHHNENNDQASWDSCQLTEAISVVNEFLKKKEKKCMNCKRKNPKIDKPTFGWFRVSGMSSADIKWNAIRSGRLDVIQSGWDEDKASFEVVNASEYSWKVDSETGEAHSFNVATDSTKKGIIKSVKDRSNYFDGPLSPSEVKDILRRLWENEAPMCSYISDIQHQFSGTITGYSMFFLETICVPPIKSRPPAKGGDSVMEQPHTRLLGKVLQSNIAMGNAHMNNSEHPSIICRWMDLQQSINALFDCKTASKTASSQFRKDAYCQLLEKEEAIFRQRTMGYPPYFGLRLRHPQGVAHLDWNAAILKGRRH